jgi:hypothetical protein
MSYTVNYDDLQDLGEDLGRVRDEFKNVEDNTDNYDGAMGSGHVVGKLHEFSENWSDKREQLVEQLDGVSQAALAAAEGYRCTDQELAKGMCQ